MSIPPPPQPYEVCDPEEKLRRLKWSYANGRISLKKLEEYTELALLEEDYYDAKDSMCELTPQQLATGKRLDEEHEARMKAWRERP